MALLQSYSLLVNDPELAMFEKVNEGCKPDMQLTSFQQGPEGLPLAMVFLAFCGAEFLQSHISHPRILRALVSAREAPGVNAVPGEAGGGTQR